MQWYYAKDNEQLGPIDGDEFQRLIDTNQILATDLVWNTTLPDWTPAASIAGLFPNSAASLLPTYDSFEPTATDFSKLTDNSEILYRARTSLQNNWKQAVAAHLLYSLIVGVISNIPLAGGVAIFIITGPLTLGLSLFFLSLVRKTDRTISMVFDGFKTFEVSLVTYLLTLTYTLLWALLFIIPGIIAAISYSQVYYIIIDNPSISAQNAITRSKEMMIGNKVKYFTMQLRFLGWILLVLAPAIISWTLLHTKLDVTVLSNLAMATTWIGLLWLNPYIKTAQAEFHEDLRKAQQPIK